MIKLIKPYIEFDEAREGLEGIFDSGIFTKGQYSKAFPKRIAEYTGAKHAFLTTSATTALTMSMHLAGVGPGDEVIVSDFSFPATVNVVEDLGATPIFADVSLDTYNMDPADLERKITPRTKAVIFVDALGNPSGILDIRAVCRDRGIVFVEDAACAMGSSADGIKCGRIADISCFSMHPRKLVTCGEGGAVTVDSDEYADVLRVKLNTLKNTVLRWVIKFAVFNAATVLVYLLLFALLGPAVLDELLADGTAMLVALLAAGNLSFWLCDRALAALTRYYHLVVKPKLKKKF